MIKFYVRLIRKDDGTMYPGEFEAPLHPREAAFKAIETFGEEHHIVTIYPVEHHLRAGFDFSKCKAVFESTVQREPEIESDWQVGCDPYGDDNRIEAWKSVLFQDDVHSA